MDVKKRLDSRTNKTFTVKVGNSEIGGSHFSVIAGPCSIEGRDQFEETALGVKKFGAHLLRGGIWKMRTQATSFQGLGPEAVQFVKDVLDLTQMSLVTEVTDPRQIAILDDFVGMYQVGARNMFNYALLKELGQTRKPVLLKRGFSAMVDEWLQATEYISKGGNDQIVLCERGIRTFENSTRYTFDLNSVLVAKSRSPYPVIVDPSHSVGVREFVPQLAYAAAAVGADGIIVEVHLRPAEALSDGKQALTLQDFEKMMDQLNRILAAVGRPAKSFANDLHQRPSHHAFPTA